MKIIFGLIIVSTGFMVALNHLNQHISQFWDVIAFAVVVFGTIAVAIMTLPSMKIKNIFDILWNGLKNNHQLREDSVINAMFILRGKVPTGKATRLDQRILVDGIELLKLGFSTEKIKDILIARIEKYIDECHNVSSWVKGLSKYPPAFGLAGTVLGLVHLMKGLAEGANPKETGLRMAVALIATFYGIVVANIIVNPIGDRISNNTIEDQNLAEISLNAIVLLSERTNYVEAIEQMNNYMPNQSKKIKFEGLLEAS